MRRIILWLLKISCQEVAKLFGGNVLYVENLGRLELCVELTNPNNLAVEVAKQK